MQITSRWFPSPLLHIWWSRTGKMDDGKYSEEYSQLLEFRNRIPRKLPYNISQSDCVSYRHNQSLTLEYYAQQNSTTIRFDFTTSTSIFFLTQNCAHSQNIRRRFHVSSMVRKFHRTVKQINCAHYIKKMFPQMFSCR